MEKLGEKKHKVPLQIRLERVSAFSGFHEANTKEERSNVRFCDYRECLEKVASLIGLVPANDSTTPLNSVFHLFFITHLNISFLCSVHFYLEAFYGNSVF